VAGARGWLLIVEVIPNQQAAMTMSRGRPEGGFRDDLTVRFAALAGQPARPRSVEGKRYHIAGGGVDPADPLTSTRRNDRSRRLPTMRGPDT
jgi:hypothetical protein